jgi:hypothetical protein
VRTTFPPSLLKVVVAFAKAWFPDRSPPYEEALNRLPERFLSYWDFRRFDHPIYRWVIPFLFRALQWAPVFLFWYAGPKKFTSLPLQKQILFLQKLERSKLYILRGLFVACKLLVSMVLLEDPILFPLLQYDGKGILYPYPVHPPRLERAGERG